MDWGEKEIATETHCDAGRILAKTGSRAQIGICGFLRKHITDQAKMKNFRKELRFHGGVIKVLY